MNGIAALVVSAGASSPRTSCPALSERQAAVVRSAIRGGARGASDARSANRARWSRVPPGCPRVSVRVTVRSIRRPSDNRAVGPRSAAPPYPGVTTVTTRPTRGQHAANGTELIAGDLASCSRGAPSRCVSRSADLDRPRRRDAAVPALHARGPRQA